MSEDEQPKARSVRLVTRHHLEVFDGTKWKPIAIFNNTELERAKKSALEEIRALRTDDLNTPDELPDGSPEWPPD